MKLTSPLRICIDWKWKDRTRYSIQMEPPKKAVETIVLSNKRASNSKALQWSQESHYKMIKDSTQLEEITYICTCTQYWSIQICKANLNITIGRDWFQCYYNRDSNTSLSEMDGVFREKSNRAITESYFNTLKTQSTRNWHTDLKNTFSKQINEAKGCFFKSRVKPLSSVTKK